ncbi:hypothetical protein AXX16_3114 [Serratia rubidaea]|nr:hypothetical protein AXX16_3114 [Serratia rubidaea]
MPQGKTSIPGSPRLQVIEHGHREYRRQRAAAITPAHVAH